MTKDSMTSPSPSQFGSNLYGQPADSMTSPSPSQFGANLYGQPAGMGTLTIQARSMSNAPFQRNVTPTSMPTSMAQNFALGLQQPQMQQPPQQQPQQAPQLPQQQQLSPNRNLFSSFNNVGVGSQIGGQIGGQRGILPAMPGQLGSQIKRPNPAASGLLSSTSNTISSMSLSMSSMSSLSAFPRTNADGTQPSLDLSEFPTLGNRAPPNPLPAVRNYGIVSKPVQDPTPEFQIQQEDFPALPGAQNPATSTSTSTSAEMPIPQSYEFQPAISSSAGPYDQALKDIKFPVDKMGTTGQQKRGIQTHPDGTVSNLPAGMVMDQFGMVGLLTFIRAAEIDPNLVALAPGIDLTTLGLNLNSPENLYNTFQSPWADAPCRPQDIDFHVPTEYLTNMFIRDKLAPIKLNRYGEDLLFFLFFMNGADVLQLAAAAELYNRDWRYHKEERVWITRAPGMEPVVKTSTYERGTYYYFDVQNWRKVPKEFYLEYDKLEERPNLPHFSQE